MTKTEHFCDRCATKIDRRTLLRVEAGAIRAQHETIEFCGACANAFKTFMGQGAKPAVGACEIVQI